MIDYSEELGGRGYKSWCFRQVNRWYIEKHFPKVEMSDLDMFARKTKGLYGDQIKSAIREYLDTGKIAKEALYVYTNPITGEVVERAFNPFNLMAILKKVGFSSVLLFPSTRLRGDETFVKRIGKLLLKYVPPLNGFLPFFRIVARKGF